MQRTRVSFAIPAGEQEHIKQRMLNWSKKFSILLLLDSNNNHDRYSRYELLLAAGAEQFITAQDGLDALYELHRAEPGWWFGNICYDYKNYLEPRLSSRHSTRIPFPGLYFFRPQIVCYIEQGSGQLVIESLTEYPVDIYNELMATPAGAGYQLPAVCFRQLTGKEQYLQTISALRSHIKAGDCYEINYCTGGYAEDVTLDPTAVFAALNNISKAPFAAYYRNNGLYMMCASPERYLRKEGEVICSQPIKGTARRDSDTVRDAAIKESLLHSIKDRAENVMITDLVRNDLARSCTTGSIEVEELFGIHSFPQVHQMISTVKGRLKEGLRFTDAIKYSFPMGSMTGAPKIKVMELTDRYEDTRRGLFSGTVGYITPAGDFDFNVVIRSLFYNAEDKYLQYQAGGAITYDSDPEAEWDEMRLKAWALERIFAAE